MKLSTKIILPIILISALLISLSGCIIPTVTPSPGETTTGGTITGTFETPEACCMSNRDHTEGWVPLVNATVSVIDSKGVAHTTKTDSDGKYWLTDVAPGIYYVVTACCECEDREGVYKDVVEEKLKEGDTYDAGIADCESTALGLMVDYLLSGDVFVEEDCNCYCNCFDEESLIYASLVTTGVKLRVAAINLLNPATKPLEKIRTNADFQGFVVELCDLLEACCVEPGFTPTTGGTTPTVPTVSISLTKIADKECYTPGGTLLYTLTVKNTGSVALTDVKLTDDLIPLNVEIPDLAVGDSWMQNYKYVVSQEQTGTLTNNAEVSGTYGTKTVSATASVSLKACITPEPGIKLTKTVDKECYIQGETLLYTLTVTNTGNVDLTDVKLADDLIPLNVDIGNLAVGAFWKGDYKYKVPEDQTGILTNKAEVKGIGAEIIVSDTASVSLKACITPEPGIKLTKTVDKECYIQGETLLYTLTVTNTGNVDLTDVKLADDLIPLNVDIGNLAVGAFWKGDYKYKVPEDQTGILTNKAEVKGIGAEIIVSDTASVSLKACITPEPPVANAGPDQCIQLDCFDSIPVLVDFNGELSYVTTGDHIVTWNWTWVDDNDPSNTGTLDNKEKPSANFNPGEYTVTLVVTDDQPLSSAPDEMKLRIYGICDLPDQLYINYYNYRPYGGTHYFNINITGGGIDYDISDGNYSGWCADYAHTGLPTGKMNVFCSYGYDPQDAWNKINYIINTYHKGDSVPGHPCFEFTMMDIQKAIWNYTDPGYCMPSPKWKAELIIADAEANGADFCPSEGELYAAILVWAGKCPQKVFIEVVRINHCPE